MHIYTKNNSVALFRLLIGPNRRGHRFRLLLSTLPLRPAQHHELRDGHERLRPLLDKPPPRALPCPRELLTRPTFPDRHVAATAAAAAAAAASRLTGRACLSVLLLYSLSPFTATASAATAAVGGYLAERRSRRIGADANDLQKALGLEGGGEGAGAAATAAAAAAAACVRAAGRRSDGLRCRCRCAFPAAAVAKPRDTAALSYVAVGAVTRGVCSTVRATLIPAIHQDGLVAVPPAVPPLAATQVVFVVVLVVGVRRLRGRLG